MLSMNLQTTHSSSPLFIRLIQQQQQQIDMITMATIRARPIPDPTAITAISQVSRAKRRETMINKQSKTIIMCSLYLG